MDPVEKSTKEFLESLGLGAVRFEPLGPNTFPDFDIGGQIAVESTRLVRYDSIDGKEYCATEMEPRIIGSLGSTIRSVDRKNLQGFYFIGIDYRLDMDTRSTQRRLKICLEKLSNEIRLSRQTIVVDEFLEIEIFPSSKESQSAFDLGLMSNRSGTYWAGEQFFKQIKEAVARKSTRNLDRPNRYQEWWLAVVGDVVFNPPSEYFAILRQELSTVSLWTHLAFINPFAPSKSLIFPIGEADSKS